MDNNNITPLAVLKKLHSTIWSSITISERARNIHGGVDNISNWVTIDGTLDIYGIKPKTLNFAIGDVVLLYVQTNGNIKPRVVGAGRVSYHRYNSIKIYDQERYNEYAVYLDRVMFFPTPITSDTPHARLGNNFFSDSLKKGSNVVTRVCADPEKPTVHKDLWLNLISDLLIIPSFYNLFCPDPEVSLFQAKRMFMQANYTRYQNGERHIVQDVQTLDGTMFGGWTVFRSSATGEQKLDDVVEKIPIQPGVYELGYAHDAGYLIGNQVGDPDVTCTYVGKSCNLRARLRNHVKPEDSRRSEKYKEKLKNGSVLVWRHMCLASDDEARAVEYEFLFLYNYLWNVANNV